MSLTDSEKPMVACWVGEKDGHFWFHLGDRPHWGPRMEHLKEYGGYALRTVSGFMACTIDESGLKRGEAIDMIDGQRTMMSRDDAIKMLGNPPQG